MNIIKKVVKTATHKGRILKFIYVQLDNGKWYEAQPCIYGYMLKEV